MMRSRLITLPAVVLALLCAPTIAQQEESERHFTLTTDKTFGSGEKPKIRLWGQGIQSLQFRVYKVHDVTKFFRELENPNQFGGESHRLPSELTVLERFHVWKHTTRSRMRNLVRRQYTTESRAIIRDALLEREAAGHKNRAVSASMKYADVPVLNQQQLVATWEQPYKPANRWEAQMVPLDVTERGVYMVEATDGKLQAYTIVCISDLVLLSKSGEGVITARAVDRRTGHAVTGAEIYGWIRREEVVRARTGHEGFASIKPSPSAKAPEGAEQSMMLLAHRGSDYAPLAVSEWSMRSMTEGGSLTAYMYTDRPVYRPGHQVHFKAIVRTPGSFGYKLPPAADVRVEIEDPDGKSVMQRSLRPGPTGSISGDFAIPVSAALGYYSISLRSGEQYVGNSGFHVEEYRKPEYEVRVTPQTPRVLQGDKVRATINARYYFGEPVPGAKVTYVVHRSRYWLPWYDEDREEEQSADTDQDEYLGNEQILEQTGQLDGNGNLSIEFDSEKTGHDLRYRIEARVTDEANREVSGTGYVLATRARFFIHAEPDRYVYEPGEQARIRVESRDYDGKPVGNIPFSVELVSGWKNPRTIGTASGRTNASGQGYADIKVTSGSLHAKVVAKDGDGREAEDTAWLWVSGDAGEWGRQQRVEIVPDKKTYKDGDTAKVLIVTGVQNASVWVTAESRGVIVSRIIQTKGSTGTFELPIRGDYSPNIFVNATFIRDGQMYLGSKSLRVPPVDQKLNVSVKPSKPQFKPGERGTYTIEAKDASGNPVNAEFSLGVVDEAIYAIRREAAPDMLNFFYGRRYNEVQTISSLHYMFSGSSGKRRMQLTALRTDRRAQLKPEKFVDPRVRKAFPDTIYWVADVRTGAAGKVEVPVEFPDSLTTWRATARGITPETRVGSAVERTIVRKNLILRLTAPRFFMQGDEMTVAAIVQNYLTTDKTVRVSLDAKGLELVDGGTPDVTVVARGTAQVFYRLRATAPGSAVLLGKALTDEESDALELTVPINPYGVRLSESKTGIIDSGSEADVQMNIPADANPATRTVEITLSPSVAGTLFSALDYLVTFPYGCTEQTMSSFLPNVIVSKAQKELGLSVGVDEADLVRKTRAGMERLYSFQHEDGGWGWWQTDDSSPFMTAYVVAGLAQARMAGYQIRSDAVDKAVEWLKTELPKKGNVAPDLRAYVAYSLALAGSNNAEFFSSVWDNRSKLSPYGTALLGLALQAMKDPRASQLAERLERSARSNDREVWWEMSVDPLLEIPMNVNSEATAFAMHFLSGVNPQSALLPKAALYLVNHREGGYYWSSTKQTAMVIFGLTGYLKATKELQPSFTASVVINGAAAGSKQFTSADPWKIRVPASEVNSIHFGKAGTGRLYWSARTEYFGTKDQASSTNGTLSITREYFRLVPDRKGDKITYRLEPLRDTVEKGDTLAVRLRVQGSDWNYLMTEDPIPSGTEFISRDDLYELAEKPAWWARWYSRREFHDDHMALFQRWFPKGESEQSYLLKVTSSGKFRVPPARVEPMYQPGIYAVSGGRALEVR